MSGWQTLAGSHFPDYPMMTIDEIIGKECYIIDYEEDEITKEDGDVPVIHFLVHLIDDNKNVEVRTGAVAIVRTIARMSPEKVKELIQNKEPTRFVKEKTKNGYTMYKME